MKRTLAMLLIALASACESTPARRGARAPAVASSPAPTLTIEEQVRGLERTSLPGEMHHRLDPLAGEWTVEFVDVDSEGRESAGLRGEARIAWTFEGRFLEWDVQVTLAGAPRRTRGFLGYDLNAREYQWLSISNLATGMGVARAQGDLVRDGLLFTLELSDARNGGRMRSQSRLRLVDADHFVQESLAPEDAGARVLRRTKYSRKH
jgi:hypothetical protein